jgi:localization factor PodJL
MSGQSPWSVKGVEPKTREAAKDLARREGLTLGELLNRLIADTEEPRSPARQAPKFDPDSSQSSGHDADRLTSALEQLTRRLEASGLDLGPNSLPAPAPQDEADPTGYQDASPSNPSDALGRTDTNLEDLHETQAVLAEKMHSLEAKHPDHSSLAGMRELEAALAALSSQVASTENRVGDVEKITEEALQTIDQSLNLVTQRLATTETLAQETNNRFVDGMVDLSARLTGLESMQDSAGAPGSGDIGDRLSQIENFSVQARENLEQDMAMIGERAGRIEEFVRDHANRMVEALIELSARLTQVEGIGTTGDLRLAIEALETKTGQVASQLAELDTNLGDARADLHQQVEAAITSTIERRFIDLAQALADRLDATEKRNNELLDGINGKILHTNDDLNQRLTQLETRSQLDSGFDHEDVNAQLERLTRSIDERLSAIESQDASELAQAGKHFQILAETLSKRLDANENQSARTIELITQQMDNLADRLEANQEDALEKLTTRLEGHESRTQVLLDEALGRVRLELQAAEDRTQAASLTLAARLDTVEQATVAPYAEAILNKSPVFEATSSLAFDPDALNAIDDYSFETGPGSFGSTSYEDPFAAREPSSTPAQSAPPRGRTGGFASPLPTDSSAEEITDFASFEIKSLSLDEPLSAGEGQAGQTRSDDDSLELGEDLFGAPLLDGYEGDTESDFSSLDQDWNEPPSLGDTASPAYLTQARNAAEPAAAQAKKGPGFLAKKSATGRPKAKTGTKQGDPRAAKSKPGLSPVAMAAAAALVATGGFAVYSQMQSSSELNQKPDALNKDAAAPIPSTALLDAPSQSSNPTPQALPPAPITVPPAALPSGPKFAAEEPIARPSFTPPRPVAKASPEKAQFNPPTATTPSKARFTQPPIERARPATKPAKAIVPTVTTPAPQPPSKEALSPAPALSSLPSSAAISPSPALVAPPLTAPSPSPAAPSRPPFEQALAREQAGDIAGSIALLNRAVDAGDVRAMNRLAKKYETGDGVAKDLGQARALTERAAARGSTEAMHNLGVYYAQGDGVPSNMVRAADYFRRAARRGIADSQFNLGAMAEQGLGGPKSDLQAYYWYGIASKSGDQDAAAKAREVGQRLTTEQRAAQDKLIAQFRPEASPAD